MTSSSQSQNLRDADALVAAGIPACRRAGLPRPAEKNSRTTGLLGKVHAPRARHAKSGRQDAALHGRQGCLPLRKLILVAGGILFAGAGIVSASEPATLEAGFRTPPLDNRPESWFHLIGGNVSKAGLTTDLEAVAGAGLQGIQLFHGSGRKWPGVEPQIACLSPEWDGMIGHVADETRRLGLRFTMQNCPGWAMSGGPWITPDKAMRHIISSRVNVAGGGRVSVSLDRPQPSDEKWRDYQDIAVLAFPTPVGDDGGRLKPVEVQSNRKAAWSDLLAEKKDAAVRIAPGKEPAWLEITFAQPAALRSIELPPVELLMQRRNYDPDSRIVIQIQDGKGWKDLIRHPVPRGTWQDRQEEFPLVLAVPETQSAKYRIVFENNHPMELSYLRLSPAARVHDWRGQAGFAMRSLDRAEPPAQARGAWVARDSVLDLSDKMDANGQLTWDAPAGRWTVVRFGHVNTGAKNKPAPPEATGFECDKLSPVGAEQHFAGYIGRLSQPGGPADSGRLQGMVIDSWECYTQTWTPAMEREFERRRGYALRRWLPALAGWVVDDPRTTERFLRDWRATIGEMIEGGRQFLAWQDGDYKFSRKDAKPVAVNVSGTRAIPLETGWTLSFPPGWDVPASLDLGGLKPWSELEDKAASHFPGSAVYRATVRLDALKADERLWLDLGRVGDIAEVRINGRKVAALWAAPFRVDITSHVKAGDNEIEIELTNTWFNRLAYDAGLPEDHRKTWTYNAPDADAPLEFAGLGGLVRLRVGKVVELSK